MSAYSPPERGPGPTAVARPWRHGTRRWRNHVLAVATVGSGIGGFLYTADYWLASKQAAVGASLAIADPGAKATPTENRTVPPTSGKPGAAEHARLPQPPRSEPAAPTYRTLTVNEGNTETFEEVSLVLRFVRFGQIGSAYLPELDVAVAGGSGRTLLPREQADLQNGRHRYLIQFISADETQRTATIQVQKSDRGDSR